MMRETTPKAMSWPIISSPWMPVAMHTRPDAPSAGIYRHRRTIHFSSMGMATLATVVICLMTAKFVPHLQKGEMHLSPVFLLKSYHKPARFASKRELCYTVFIHGKK